MSNLNKLLLAGQFPPGNNSLNHFEKLFAQKVGDSGVITTTTGNPVSIVTNKAQNAISTLLSFSPKQSGSGDPSPINIRPIVPWTEANLGINSETPTLTISLGGTYYGFSVDIERGVLRATKYGVDLADCSGQNSSAATGYKRRMFNVQGATLNVGGNYMICTHCKGAYNGSGARVESVCSESRNSVYLQLSDETLNGLTVNEYVQSQHNNGTPVFVVGNLNEPLEIPLTPQTVSLLSGTNTLWTDGDEISITYKAKRA